jgi:hypothetical protein
MATRDAKQRPRPLAIETTRDCFVMSPTADGRKDCYGRKILGLLMRRSKRRQMIACRTFADTHSLTITVAMITSRINDTCVQ